MRKNLLLLVAAVLLPCLAWADNMAIEKKRAAAYGNNTPIENRLGIPLEALGFSNPMNGSECYTVAAWIKPSNVHNNEGVVLALSPQVHMNANGNWVLKTTSTGTLAFSGHGGTNHGAESVGLVGKSFTKGITLDEWNYVTVVVDNENLRLAVYVDGENALDTELTDTMYFPANLVNGDDGPGWIHVGGYALDALIDEVHCYNRALTADEVAKAYKNPALLGGLTGYYTFDEQNGTGYFDNIAPNAAENSSAVFWKWSGTYLWGGWINGSNVATEATLVAGREIEAPEPVTRTYVGTCDYDLNNSYGTNYPNRTLTFNREADGTYSIRIQDIPYAPNNVDFTGITREGDKISGHMDSMTFMGDVITGATLDGTMTESNIKLTISGQISGIAIEVHYEGSNLSSVGNVAVDNADAPAEYYTLQGVRVPADNLTPGLYIVRRGATVTKAYIR